MMGKKRMAGEAMRTAFGGGAITGESADRRAPTEEMVMGNPMAHPMAADSVKMPQDLVNKLNEYTESISNNKKKHS